MDKINWLEKASEQHQLRQVIELNNITQKFGITITEEDALVLITDKKFSLVEKQRIEFEEGILPELIKGFCDSPHIYQENFLEVMGRLQDIFYQYKNDSMDLLSDDELITFMKNAFEGECEGSTDFLEETVLEEFARSIRVQGMNFLEHYFREREVEDE